MLSLMRKHAGTWIIKIILGAIVIVFVFWGVGSWTSQRQGRIAKVNGDWISAEEYRTTYNQLLEQVRQTFGNNLNDELLKSLQLKKRALDQLIDKTIMLQAAKNLNLRVSDQDLAQSIRSIGAFQVAGVFDSRRYQNVLGQNQLTPEAFEVAQKDALLIGKLRAFITDSVKVSDQEVMEWYKWKESKVSLDYVLVDPNRYKDIKPSPVELNEFFERNKAAYKTEPQVKVRYIAFKPEAYRAQVKISDGEIRDYYETHPEEFKTPKTVEARHILIKVDPDAGPEKVAEAKKRIEDILKLAREGKDFAQLARQYSEGPSKDKGGYLGAFTKDSMVKPFAEKAFAMKAGEISDPVRTRFGWHIIKVEKVNPATTRSLDEARGEIRKKLIDEQAKNLAYEAAESAYDASFDSEDLAASAASEHLQVVETDFFTRKGPVKGVKDGEQFAKVAFDLPEGEISEVQDLEDGYYLLQVVARKPGEIPDLKSVTEKVKADWVKEKQDQKAHEDAAKLLSDLKNGQSLEAASRKLGLKPGQTGFFKRNDAIPDIGFEPQIAGVAFSLSKEKELPADAVKGQKGYYVIRFRERQAPSMEEYDKQKAEIRESLLQQKKYSTFNAWLQETRNKSAISITEGFQTS
jgi:peptidyl-prolyl cis-trans isomerase D